MFSEYEKRIIVMALMYLKNDHTPEDLEDLGLADAASEIGREWGFEEKVHELIEDFVGPTWDEETTTENIKRETEKRSRKF